MGGGGEGGGGTGEGGEGGGGAGGGGEKGGEWWVSACTMVCVDESEIRCTCS